MNEKIFSAITAMSIFLVICLCSPVLTQGSDPGCTNGDCLVDPGCTNGDCTLSDPGCTNGDCPLDPGCTNGDCPPDPGCTNGGCDSDLDGDHYTAQHDCDDSDASIHPFAPELCDGKG